MNKPLDEIAQARAKIPAKEYNQMMKQLDLVSVFLKDIKVTHYSHEMKGKNSYTFKERVRMVEHDAVHALVEVEYTLTAKSGGKRLIRLVAKYRTVFGTEKELTKEFFTIYNAASLPLQTFPYFRELTNSMFSRTGLPPLILPLRKFLIAD